MFDSIVSSIFSMRNFFDEISIIDREGIIRYCEIFPYGTYSLTADEIVGKHIFEVFPAFTDENSDVCKVLRTGKPVCCFEENCITCKGETVKGYSSMYPLYRKKELVGVAVALKFLAADSRREAIEIQEHAGIPKTGSRMYTIDDIITADPYMDKIKNKIRKVSDADSAVLIQGKTGTGKELVAQSLHFSSKRAAGPFVSQNCSAIPGNLLESTLFGTNKGSYTGAITNKGLFELADGGTLFLDEINSMELALQGKLLKAIETKSVRHLGGHEDIMVNVRIVAAINEDPFTAIEQFRLRSDLFYRLNVISFQLSDLKDRPGDIWYLTDYFVAYYNDAFGKKIRGLNEEAVSLFRSHSWPGNVRELRNMIEGAFAVAEGELITREDLPGYLQAVGEETAWQEAGAVLEEDLPLLSFEAQVENFERELIEKAIAEAPTKAEAAKRLGMTKQMLNYKLNKMKRQGSQE